MITTEHDIRKLIELRMQRRMNWLLHIAIALLSLVALAGNPFSVWDDYVTAAIWLTLAIRAGRAVLRAAVDRAVARELQRQQDAWDADASRQMARYTLKEKRKGDLQIAQRTYRPQRIHNDEEQVEFDFLDDTPTQQIERVSAPR